jgi:signal peptidase I
MDVGTQVQDAPDVPVGRGRHLARQPRGRRWLIETATVVAIAVLVAVLLRTFVVGTYSIPSGSMEPTLQIGDRILVDKLSYDLHGIGRSDIIVFTTPPLEHCAGAPVPDLVKRVIGLSGETISLAGGQVYINGKLLSQPWLTPTAQHDTFPPAGSTQPYALVHPFKIPAGKVFVMGDNRGESCDSRYWGPIEKSTIVGKVDLRFWPIGRLHIF